MARNNNKMTKRHKMPKIEPAVLKMVFATETIAAGGSATFNLDLSQSASLMNRRFYRQGLNWAVSGIKALTTGLIGSVYTTKLPTTWTMSNAWEKGFRSWEDMNDAALEEAPSVKPRFLDFKIFSNAQHHNVGYAANLLPLSLDSAIPLAGVSTAIAGEWESAKLRIPVGIAVPGDTTEREIIAVGANYPGNGASGINAVSLIEGYAASRGLPNILDPNVPDDASDADGLTPQNWMSALKNQGTEQVDKVLEDLITENNIAPYPFENGPNPLTPGVGHPDTMYPGGANQLSGLEIHDLSFITSSTIGGQTRIPGGIFGCGLIQFSVFNTGSVTANMVFEVELVPGTHRGYLAEPMQDM